MKLKFLKFWKKDRPNEASKPIYGVPEKKRRLDGKGRIVLPRRWRRRLGLEKGDEVNVRFLEHYIELWPVKKQRLGEERLEKG